MRVVRTLSLALLAAGAAASIASCGGSSGGTPAPSATGSAGSAPEDKRASATEVASGLRQVDRIAAAAAAAVDGDKEEAAQQVESIEPVWEDIEGTVKANDSDAYITFEDNFAVLQNAAESGDTTKAQGAASAVHQAVTAYLAKYPG